MQCGYERIGKDEDFGTGRRLACDRAGHGIGGQERADGYAAHQRHRQKGTLNEIRLNTSTITFQYTLPGYLEAQNEWDADWTEYVHGTPDVTVTFADGSTKKLELQELHGDLEPEVMKTYTHYFGLADAIDLENAETLTVNGTDYTLHG